MCAILSASPIGKLRGRLGDPGIKLTRAVDRQVFGYDDQTKYLGGGGERNYQGTGQVDLFRSFMSRQGLGLGARKDS